MNPVDHYTAVGYTHRDIAQALLNPLVSIPVDAIRKNLEWQRRQVPTMCHDCEVCNLPPDDQQLLGRLHEFLGIAPGEFAQVLFVNDDTVGVAPDYGVVFPNLLGRFSGEELLARIGGFGTMMRGQAYTAIGG